MNPWMTDSAWQNFSSMFREAVTSQEAQTGMEKSHHLTASLYFGIAALEAFINKKMRAHLRSTKSEREIVDVLRTEKIMSKLRRWPAKLLGATLNLGSNTFDQISLFNDVRGDLTHPKTHGHDIYKKLEEIDANSVISSIAEYIVCYHEAEDTVFPYWVFGWNYLNPRSDSYEIFVINEQQFCFSLQALGFELDAALPSVSDQWQKRYLGTRKGYFDVVAALNALDRCEPKPKIFPFKPILCRRWWTSEHQRICGNVTKEALDFAINFSKGRR